MSDHTNRNHVCAKRKPCVHRKGKTSKPDNACGTRGWMDYARKLSSLDLLFKNCHRKQLRGNVVHHCVERRKRSGRMEEKQKTTRKQEDSFSRKIFVHLVCTQRRLVSQRSEPHLRLLLMKVLVDLLLLLLLLFLHCPVLLLEAGHPLARPFSVIRVGHKPISAPREMRGRGGEKQNKQQNWSWCGGGQACVRCRGGHVEEEKGQHTRDCTACNSTILCDCGKLSSHPALESFPF